MDEGGYRLGVEERDGVLPELPQTSARKLVPPDIGDVLMCYFRL